MARPRKLWRICVIFASTSAVPFAGESASFIRADARDSRRKFSRAVETDLLSAAIPPTRVEFVRAQFVENTRDSRRKGSFANERIDQSPPIQVGPNPRSRVAPRIYKYSLPSVIRDTTNAEKALGNARLA